MLGLQEKNAIWEGTSRGLTTTRVSKVVPFALLFYFLARLSNNPDAATAVTVAET